MKRKLLKLAKMVLSFEKYDTEKGSLIYEGVLEIGTEVFIEQDGEMIPAPDDTYDIYVVKDGKVVDIIKEEENKEETIVEEALEEVDNSEMEKRLADVESKLAEALDRIAKLENTKEEAFSKATVSVTEMKDYQGTSLGSNNRINNFKKFLD